MKPALMLLIMAVIMAAILVIAACAPLQPQENKSAKSAECTSDADCGVGGCSGQVCTTAAEAEGLITTCEYRAEYDCLKLTSCGCVEGKCAWKETAEYGVCLNKLNSQ